MATKVTNSVSSEALFEYLSTKFNIPENARIMSINLNPCACVSINYEYFDGRDVLTGYEILTYKD
jgi:hypothetical protein